MEHKMQDDTRIIHAGRNPKIQGWMVNPPIYQSSTIAFPTYEDFLEGEKGYVYNEFVKPDQLKYGRYGTESNFSLERAIAELEGGFSTITTSSGAAAVNSSMLAFTNQGDHILMVDNTYSPTRQFNDNFLTKFGISTTYYDPCIGAGIEDLIQENTKVIFMESPGSVSFEVQDVRAICAVAKKYGIITIMDNSWSSGIYFKPLEHGVDISVMALTKYINGHSDVIMGAITTREVHYKTVYDAYRYAGTTAAPFSCYLTQRGLRTAKVRMDHASKTALALAQWLETRPEVIKVLYPALPSDKGHALWKRDFTGAAGVFSIVLDRKYSPAAIANMLDSLHYYGIGYSWGGYESIIVPFNANKARTAVKWPYGDNTCFRISVGLEDLADLQEDLEAGFSRLKAV